MFPHLHTMTTVDREGAKLVFKKYKETMGQLTTYEDDVFQMWNLGISKKMMQSLNRSLIVRNDDKGTLKVNFARELSSLLREVGLQTKLLGEKISIVLKL